MSGNTGTFVSGVPCDPLGLQSAMPNCSSGKKSVRSTVLFSSNQFCKSALKPRAARALIPCQTSSFWQGPFRVKARRAYLNPLKRRTRYRARYRYR